MIGGPYGARFLLEKCMKSVDYKVIPVMRYRIIKTTAGDHTGHVEIIAEADSQAAADLLIGALSGTQITHREPSYVHPSSPRCGEPGCCNYRCIFS